LFVGIQVLGRSKYTVFFVNSLIEFHHGCSIASMTLAAILIYYLIEVHGRTGSHWSPAPSPLPGQIWMGLLGMTGPLAVRVVVAGVQNLQELSPLRASLDSYPKYC
jgi:hypothetical protein